MCSVWLCTFVCCLCSRLIHVALVFFHPHIFTLLYDLMWLSSVNILCEIYCKVLDYHKTSWEFHAAAWILLILMAWSSPCFHSFSLTQRANLKEPTPLSSSFVLLLPNVFKNRCLLFSCLPPCCASGIFSPPWSAEGFLLLSESCSSSHGTTIQSRNPEQAAGI